MKNPELKNTQDDQEESIWDTFFADEKAPQPNQNEQNVAPAEFATDFSEWDNIDWDNVEYDWDDTTPSSSKDKSKTQEITQPTIEQYRPKIAENPFQITPESSELETQFSELYDNLPDESKTFHTGNQLRTLLSETLKNKERINLDQGTISKILERVNYNLNNDKDVGYGSDINTAIKVAATSKDPDAIELYLNAVDNLCNDDEERENLGLETKSKIIKSYARGHGLTSQIYEGLEKNVFPMIDDEDPEVESLQRPHNSWGTLPGDYGISDYTVACLASKNTPREIRDVMQIYREIPTSDYSKFESNRNDAAILQGTLWEGRDFIHDERPGIHEVLAAMVEFYDTKDKEKEHTKAEENLQRIINNRQEHRDIYVYAGFDGKLCLDLENYDKHIQGSKNYGYNGAQEYDCPAIDILRRLAENTAPVSLEKPHTEDAELNSLLDTYNPKTNERTGEVYVNWTQTGQIVAYINGYLQEHKNELGIRPSMVQALSYIERMSTHALRGISAKDYKELPFDPYFKEIVKFNELTTNADSFNEDEFNRFWRGFVSNFSQDWPNEINSKYAKLSQRVIKRVGKLARQYKEEGKPEYMIGSLWSGNVSDELISLLIKDSK